MTLSDLRTVLAGWLQDTANIQWPTTSLDRVINQAVCETQKHILSYDPESFKRTYYAATTVPATGKDNLYSYPAGTLAVHEIALSSDGTYYTPLERLSLKHARQGLSVVGFIPWDAKHFMLYPSPTTAVVNGLRCTVAPKEGMTDPADENPLPLAFESLLILEAQKFALYDVNEPTDKIQAEINRIREQTPRFFMVTGEPGFIVPNVTRY